MEINVLSTEIRKTCAEFLELISSLTETQINTIPFAKSWTAAQVATHVTKSNFGIAQALQMEGKPAQRSSDMRIKELSDTFLDFSIKMQSPAFIVPEDVQYKKEAVLSLLQKSNEQLSNQINTANPEEMINLPAAFGEITKLELVHFVLYHTQRHLRQLKNIVGHI